MPQSRRRWYHLSLRTALLAITVLAMALGWYRYRAEKWNEVARWQSSLREPTSDQIEAWDNVFGIVVLPDQAQSWLWAAFALPHIQNVRCKADSPKQVPVGIRDALPYAQRVELRGPGIDDSVLENLGLSLTDLELRDTSVSKKGIVKLQGHKSLESLRVTSPHLARPVVECASAWPRIVLIGLTAELSTLTDLRITKPCAARSLELCVAPDEISSCDELPGEDPLNWLSAFAQVDGVGAYGDGPIDDALLRYIAKHCPQVDVADFRSGRFSDKGMQELATLKKLEHLTFAECEFQTNAFLPLSKCPQLRSVNFEVVEPGFAEEVKRHTGIREITYMVEDSKGNRDTIHLQ